MILFKNQTNVSAFLADNQVPQKALPWQPEKKSSSTVMLMPVEPPSDRFLLEQLFMSRQLLVQETLKSA